MVPHPHAWLVSAATLICGSNCHPTPLQASPQTNRSAPQVIPPSVDLRNSTLVPGAARGALVGIDPRDELVDEVRVTGVGGDRRLPIALVLIWRASRLF